MKEVSIGLIGFGTVGAGVVKILQENRDVIEARIGFPLTLRRIADLDISSDRGISIDRSLLTTDSNEILEDPLIDIVVELIGGYEPAKTIILKAIDRGKQVVTANKALLADCGAEILGRAKRSGVDVAFEASVAGGIPILRSLREGLLANRFEKVLAILNGTCNFILTAMNENPGIPFQETLREAQSLGYAEADPSLDIDGTDTAHKLVLVLGLTHGIRAWTKDIYVEGIRAIDSFDVFMAREFSYKLKLLAVIIDHGKQVEARVHPTMLPENHLLANVDGVFNGIFLRGDMVGDQLFYGRGAGMEPTASAVVGDIVETARNIIRGGTGSLPPLGYPEIWNSDVSIMNMEQIVTNYYLRVQALDQPGVLSKIAGIMAEHCISIHSVVQKKRRISGAVPVVFLTHLAREADIQEACRKIGALDVVEDRPTIVRIEDETLA
ncbi:MAG: homoserine dehydrogenase [Thermodesulfobacteriota bacterium]|nr:homoserine dehydrogenase [Thermodesulfobacteriota bacterium]